jgi:sphingolipid delta-4 desaturase
VAAHFIQEHYTFTDGQETYSYYGWANILFLNIGYHNEHHDFPNVPWHLLPAIKLCAKESYDPLAYHGSWRSVLWTFITDKNLGPQSRVVRTPEDQKKTRKEFASSVRSAKPIETDRTSSNSNSVKPIASIESKSELHNSHIVRPVGVF